MGVKSTFVEPIIKRAATLRFLSQGSYQLSVGNDFNLGLSQPAVSKILVETLDALEETTLSNEAKSFLSKHPEVTTAKIEETQILDKYDFPGVIGGVDGKHINILTPNEEIQHQYFNRFFSIKTMIVSLSNISLQFTTYFPNMLICDHKMRIRFIDSRYG